MTGNIAVSSILLNALISFVSWENGFNHNSPETVNLAEKKLVLLTESEFYKLLFEANEFEKPHDQYSSLSRYLLNKPVIHPIFIAMFNSKTVADSLSVLTIYQSTLLSNIKLEGIKINNESHIKVQVTTEKDELKPYIIRLLSALIKEFLSLVAPERKHFAPQCDSEQIHINHTYSINEQILVVPKDVLLHEISDSEEELHDAALSILDKYCVVAGSRPKSSYSTRVKSILQKSIGQNLSLNEIARSLACSPRKLQNHLCEEKTSFSNIKEEVNFKFAKDAIRGGNITLQEISSALGFF